MNKIEDHFKFEYDRKSYIYKYFLKEFHYFDISEWSNFFKKELERLLNEKEIIRKSEKIELSNLHKYLNQDQINYNFKDGVSLIGSMFYETDKKFIDFYYNFLKFLHDKLFKFDFYFQATPTFRFHFPYAENYGASHFPRYHSDVQYGHSPREINLWFKLTKNIKNGFRLINFNDSKIWYEKFNFDFNKFIEVASSQNKKFNNYGHNISKELIIDDKTLLIFDSRCIHTGESREEDLTTRISIDIRIIPVEEYEWKIIDNNPIYKGRGRMGAEFKPGGKFGYHKKSISQI